MPRSDIGLEVRVRSFRAAALVFLFVLSMAQLLADEGKLPKALMCAPLNPWQIRNSGTTSNLHDVGFFNGNFVAVGTSTNVACSSNGVVWTSRGVSGLGTFSAGNWNSIAYANNSFVVVGARPYAAVSSNTVDWTSLAYPGFFTTVIFGDRRFCYPATNGTIYVFTNTTLIFPFVTNLPNVWWQHGAYGNQRFVCVARDGTTMTSTNGTNWVRGAAGATNLNRVAFGLGMFVAVGSNGLIVTSTDGLTWTQRVSRSAANFTAITFGDGRFVAVSDSSLNADDRLVNSRDGINWCAYPMPAGAWRAIAYGSNSYVIVGPNGAMMQSQNQTIIVSAPQNQTVCAEDPLSFSVEVSSSLPVRYQWQFHGTNISGATNATLTIPKCFPEDAGVYSVIVTDDRIPVSASATGTVDFCRAMERWTLQAPQGYQSNGINSIACNGDTMVAVGSVGTVARSIDGVTWALANAGTNVALNGVAYGAGRFIAIGFRGVILSSADGATWTLQNSGTNGNLRGITYADGKFVVVGGNTYVLTSSDGVTWTPYLTGTNRAAVAIAHADGQFVSVGPLGVILISPNGTAWSVANSGVTSNLFRVATDGSSFVVAGDRIVLRSENGSDWTPQTTPVTNVWRSLCFAHGRFVLAGDPGVLLTSRDGIVWARQNSRVTNLVNAVAGCGDYFYMGFNDGLLSQSAFAAPPRLIAELKPPLFTLKMVGEIGAPMHLQTREGSSAPWLDALSFTNTRTTGTIFSAAATNEPQRFYQIQVP